MVLKKKVVEVVADAAGKLAESASEIVADTSKQKNATNRHVTDMQADNKLSKLIRPLVTIWAIVAFTAIAVLGYFGYVADPEIKSTLNLVLGLSVGFYFPGRTLEKWIRGNTTSIKQRG